MLLPAGYTTSAWLVVFLGVERIIIVCLPFRARSLCSRRRACIAVCVLPLIFLAVYSYDLAVWEVDSRGHCSMKPGYEYMAGHVGPWIESVLYSYLPIAVLVVVTSVISLQLWRMKKKREDLIGVNVIKDPQKATFDTKESHLGSPGNRQRSPGVQRQTLELPKTQQLSLNKMQASGNQQTSSENHEGDQEAVASSKQSPGSHQQSPESRKKSPKSQPRFQGKHAMGSSHEYKVTIMVITICVLFIVLTAPVTAFYVYLAGQFRVQSDRLALYMTLVHIVGMLNFTLNFLLYSLTSSNFRAELKSMCCGRCRRQNGNN